MALAVDSEMASATGFSSNVGAGAPSPQTFSFTNTAGTLIVLIVGAGA